LLAGPKSLGGPVALQLWRRDVSGAFERLSFGDAPVYSEALDAWVIADGRALFIAEDRAGKRRWRNETEYARADAEKAQADAEKAQADAEKARADAEKAQADAEKAQADAEKAQADAEKAQADAKRERAARDAMERELLALKAQLRKT
jgi:hypothetical protein